jgi:N-methylhydantoinase A
VIIPALPGALSAIGILESDVIKDFSRTVLWRAGGRLPRAELEKEFRKLEAAAQKEFSSEEWSGKPQYERSLDLRYGGQGYELNIAAGGANVLARFHDEHQRRYGYHHASREIEIVTLRLRARLRVPRPNLSRNLEHKHGSNSRLTPVETAPVIFQAKTISTPVYERSDLPSGRILRGPAAITEYSATTVVPPQKAFHLDTAGNLIIGLKEPARRQRRERRRERWN